MIAVTKLQPLLLLILASISLCFLGWGVQAENVVPDQPSFFLYFHSSNGSIKWGEIDVHGPKVCDVHWTYVADTGLYAINVVRCKDAFVIKNTCTLLENKNETNSGTLNCDFHNAREISHLYENAISATHFYYTSQYPSIKCNVIAENGLLFTPENDLCIVRAIRSTKAIVQKENPIIYAMITDNKLYVEHRFEVGVAFKVDPDKEYTVCSGNSTSKFKVTETLIESTMKCSPYLHFCRDVEAMGNNQYLIAGATLTFFSKKFILVAKINNDAIGISTQPSKCRFAGSYSTYCFNKDTSKNLTKCNTERCDAFSCFDMHSFASAKIGDIFVYESDDYDAAHFGVDVFMGSEKEHGFIKDSLTIVPSSNSDIGILNNHDYLSAIVKSNGIIAAKYTESSDKYRNPLICSEDKENLRICKVDTSIKGETEFNKVIKRGVDAQHFYMTFNGEEVVFSRNLQGSGKTIRSMGKSIWHGDALLAAYIDGTLYTSSNAKILRLCNDGSQALPTHFRDINVFYQQCKDNQMAFFDLTTMNSTILEWSEAPGFVYADYCFVKVNGFLPNIKLHSMRSIPEYYKKYTNATQCAAVPSGQSRSVTLGDRKSEAAKCYKIGSITLFIESPLSSNHSLRLCDNHYVRNAKCNGIRNETRNCKTFVPAYFVFHAGYAFGPSDLCKTKNSVFLSLHGLEVALTSDSDVTNIRRKKVEDPIALCKNGQLYAYGLTRFSFGTNELIDDATFNNVGIAKETTNCKVSSDINSAAVAKYEPDTKNLALVSNGFTVRTSAAGTLVTCSPMIIPHLDSDPANNARVFGSDATGKVKVGNSEIDLDKCDFDAANNIQCVTVDKIRIYTREKNVIAIKVFTFSKILFVVVTLIGIVCVSLYFYYCGCSCGGCSNMCKVISVMYKAGKAYQSVSNFKFW